MSNILNHNFRNLKLRVNRDEYWDFFINCDRLTGDGSLFAGTSLYDKCLISYIDTRRWECVGDKWLYSMPSYSWEDAVNSGFTKDNIGYTGIDNGLFSYRKDRISNLDFVNIVTGSTYALDSGDTRLQLHQVTGNTGVYEYPSKVENGVLTLNGGFYQGFFMTKCDEYSILPNKLGQDTWEFEFVLKKSELEAESDRTLNDKYPENKGIFFYIGARAENKWVYEYKKDEKDECFVLSPDEYVENAEIDPETYLIDAFSGDLNPEFTENDVNEAYFDRRNRYEDDAMGDFLDFDEIQSGATVLPRSACTESSENGKNGAEIHFVPFIRVCGCPVRRRRTEPIEEESSEIWGCDLFGEDGYLSDVGELDYDTDYIDSDVDISDFDFTTSDGVSVFGANQYTIKTDNKFLIFDRTCDGYTTRNWVEGTEFYYTGTKTKYDGNLFLLMNRTCTGYTVHDIRRVQFSADSEYSMATFYDDIGNNALAFRIDDDGSIGYRFLGFDCDSEEDDKTVIYSGSSFPGVIKEDEWCVVNVKVKGGLDDTMKLMFYVNGRLVYVTKDIPKIHLHALNETEEKQEGVAYNISLGGGTQGLADTVQVSNYMAEPDKVYPLEKYFGGSFIGYMTAFRFYNCSMESGYIRNNYEYETKNL